MAFHLAQHHDLYQRHPYSSVRRAYRNVSSRWCKRAVTDIPFLPPICFATFAIIRCCISTSSTSLILAPLPLATRLTRFVRPAGLPSLPTFMKSIPSESSSAGLMESVMQINRFRRTEASSSVPSPASPSMRPDIPGIFEVIFDSGPLCARLVSPV